MSQFFCIKKREYRQANEIKIFEGKEKQLDQNKIIFFDQFKDHEKIYIYLHAGILFW